MTTTLNLDRLALPHGGGRRLEFPVSPGSFELAGQTYHARPETISARFDVSRTSSGHAFRMSFPFTLEGPCTRCLQDAAVDLEIDVREVDQPSTDDEELNSPYVTDGELDVTRWAHDAVTLAVPAQILCRPDCAGLCTVCGESLNDADPADHTHGADVDPRWSKLSELKLD